MAGDKFDASSLYLQLTMLDERPVSPGEAAAEIGEEHKSSESASHGPQLSSSTDELRELVLVTDGIKYARVAAPQVGADLSEDSFAGQEKGACRYSSFPASLKTCKALGSLNQAKRARIDAS
jgi:hypothetical protein